MSTKQISRTINKKSPKANNNNKQTSKQQQPKPKRKASSVPRSEFSQKGLDNATMYYNNLQEPNQACIFPMGFDTPVNPGYAKSTIEIDGSGRYHMAIMRPEFKNTLELVTQYEDVTETISDSAEAGYAYTNKLFSVPITMDTSLDTTSGKLVKSSQALDLNYLHYSASKDAFIPGLKYYSGAWNVGDVNFSLNSNKSTSVSIEIGSWDLTGYTMIADKTLSLDAGVRGSYTFSLGGTNVNNLVLLVRPPSVGSCTFSAYVLFDETTAPTTRVGGVTSKTYDFFDLPGLKCLKPEYDLATQVLVFAQSWLLTNNTRVLDKGGVLAVAQLPEGTQHELPSAPSEALRYIASLSKQSKAGLPLADGAHITYVPQDLDDVLLVDKISGSTANRPSTKPIMVIAFDRGVEPASLSLALTVRMNWQYVTNSIVTAPYSAFGNAELVKNMFRHTMMDQMGSNPHHVKRIADNVRRFAADPRTKAILAGTWSAAKVIAPVVLSLLV